MRKLSIICIVLCSFLCRAQADTITPKFEIVGDYYANNYSVFFPLGWSKDGSLAYITQDVNSLGGAEIYEYQFVVTSKEGWGDILTESSTYDLETDHTYEKYHQEYNEYYDTTHFNYTFFKKIYWESHKGHFQKVLKHYQIKRDTGIFVHPISDLISEGISLIIDRKTDTINAIRVDQEISIEIDFKGAGERIFSKKNNVDENGWAQTYWGYYTDLLYYQIVGYIKSPYSDDCYLFIHEVTMGFEEPAEKVILAKFKWPK